jgi:hypothetical protein
VRQGVRERTRQSARTLSLLGALLACAVPGVANAAPAVTLTVRAGPVQGFPKTGNRAGAAASLLVEVEVIGTEYAGGPAPLTRLGLELPPGMRWSTATLPRCAVMPGESELGPAPWPPCEKSALVVPTTSATARVQFAGELLPESYTIASFDNSGGGTSFFALGRRPISAEWLGVGSVARRGGREELAWSFPLVETVPSGLDSSLQSLTLRLGTGVRRPHAAAAFSLHMPARCPRAGLRFRLVAAFAALSGLPAQTASTSYIAECPARR